MNQRRLIVGAIPAAAIFGGLVGTTVFSSHASRPVQAQDTAALTAEQKVAASSLEGAFMRIADTVSPAAVSITTIVEQPAPQITQSTPRMRVMPGTGGDSDDPFADLFGPGNSPFRGRIQPQQPRTGMARGSGVIVRSLPDGTTYVLTNDHVVENAKNNQVKVTLADETTYTGQIYRDQRSDLAIVKFKAPKPLPFVKLANSDNLHVGQWAIAIGSPFGQENTMTTGIVSALHRKKEIGDGDDNRQYSNLIQTDASINPGNSGGPLLNINGEMIGLNVAIYSPTGTNAGIGYAIPANTAQRILDQLISTGKVMRATLGVEPADIAPYMRARLGTSSGAFIRSVSPDTGADKAGIQPGDVITKFGDKSVTDEASLRDAIAATSPSKPVSVTLLRDGKPQTVTATLTPSPTDATPDAAPAAPERRPARQLGLQVGPFPDAFKEQLKITGDVKGVFVEGVQPSSPADTAGLTQYALITTVNGQPVGTVDELNKAIRVAKSGDIVTLTTARYGVDTNGKAVRGVVNILVP